MILAKRALVGFILLVALLAPAAVEASTPITLQVLVGDTCVQGSGGANKYVAATLKTPAGAKRDSFTTMSNASGQWFGCFSFFLPSSTINGGDILRVAVGGSSRSVVIPRLLPTIDRVTNTIRGKTAANSEVSVFVTHHPNFRNSRDFSFETISDAGGNWSVSTTGTFNLIGADEVAAITAIGSDLFGGQALAPYVLVEHANEVLLGYANPGHDISFTLLDGHGVPKAHGSTGTNPYGSYTAGLVGTNGDPAYPLGRDVLRSNLASDATLRVPRSYLHGDASADSVTGRCMANAPFLLLTINDSYTGRTDARGEFTKSVARKENLRRGDELRLVCMYRTGDEWIRTGIAS
jgi:hypothetical protein